MNASNNIKESIELFYTNGGSDKVYQAQIESRSEGYVVNFAYGKRGSALRTGTKTNVPVDFDKAKKIYEKLVKSKTSKGYTPSDTGVAYQGTDKQDEASGIDCQLLNPIEESQANMYCLDARYVAQEKHDGVRKLLQLDNGEVRGINRRGLYVGISMSLVEAAKALPVQSFVIDGEDMGDRLHAFDLLMLNGKDLKSVPYVMRLEMLGDLLEGNDQVITPVQTAMTTRDKQALLDALKAANAEGIVYKQADAPYEAGRPNSLGSQLKYKFYATASAIVVSINAQRSVNLGFFDKDSGEMIPSGKVTIPANYDIPQQGDITEIRYLYAMEGTNALYQPVFLGKRDDIAEAECTLDQLKYKRAA